MKKATVVLMSLLMGVISLWGEILDRPWTAVNLPPFVSITDAVAIDRYTIYGVGEEGCISVSHDGGRIWARMDLEAGTTRYRDVAFDDVTGIVAVGEGGVISTWRPFQMQQTRTLAAEWSLTGVTAENGVAIIVGVDEGDRLLTFRSESIEVELDPVATPMPDADVMSAGVKFLSTSDVVIFGYLDLGNDQGKPFILSSTDAGKSWNQGVIDERPIVLTGVANIAGKWYAAGMLHGDSKPGYFTSTDGGASWAFHEEESFRFVTDITRGLGPDIMAVGMRFVETDTEPVVIMSEIFSVDAGANWHVRDIADGVSTMRLAVAGDRLFAFGPAGTIHRRWYDRQPRQTALTPLTKHVELGAVNLGMMSAPLTVDLAVNTSFAPRKVTALRANGLDGTVIMEPPPGNVLMPGETLSVSIALNASVEGGLWGVLEVRYDTGQLQAWPIHAVSTANAFAVGTELPSPVFDLGSITHMETVVQRGDVFTNTSDKDIVVTSVGLSGDDVLSYAYADLMLPATVAPGETFALDVVFDPYYKGIYTAEMTLETTVGQVRLPLIARVREDVVENVVHFGRRALGSEVDTTLSFQHLLINSPLIVNALYGPAQPFAVTSTSPLPAEPGPYDVFELDVTADSDIHGTHSAVLGMPYSLDGTNDARVDRRVLIVEFSNEPTSVDEEPVTGASMTISPNPVTSSATIQLMQGAWSMWMLTDIHGQTVAGGALQEGQDSFDVSMDGLPGGTYTVVITSLHGTISSKVVKY